MIETYPELQEIKVNSVQHDNSGGAYFRHILETAVNVRQYPDVRDEKRKFAKSPKLFRYVFTHFFLDLMNTKTDSQDVIKNIIEKMEKINENADDSLALLFGVMVDFYVERHNSKSSSGNLCISLHKTLSNMFGKIGEENISKLGLNNLYEKFQRNRRRQPDVFSLLRTSLSLFLSDSKEGQNEPLEDGWITIENSTGEEMSPRSRADAITTVSQVRKLT